MLVVLVGMVSKTQSLVPQSIMVEVVVEVLELDLALLVVAVKEEVEMEV